MGAKIRVLKWSAAVGLVVVLAVGVGAMPDILLPSQYYLFPVEGLEAGVQTVSEAVQTAGYVVIRFSGNSATALRGFVAAEGDVAALLREDHVLVVDGDRFVLRSKLPGITYSLRPAGNGTELVVSTSEETPVFEALAAIFGELQSLGILGMDIDLEAVQSFSAASLKGPATPAGVALDSVLYDLVVAEDWFAYASAKGIALVGLSIEVVAEKVAGAAFPEGFMPYVVSETERLTKLVLPIDRLVALAKESTIGYVRMPLSPVAP